MLEKQLMQRIYLGWGLRWSSARVLGQRRAGRVLIRLLGAHCLHRLHRRASSLKRTGLKRLRVVAWRVLVLVSLAVAQGLRRVHRRRHSAKMPSLGVLVSVTVALSLHRLLRRRQSAKLPRLGEKKWASFR